MIHKHFAFLFSATLFGANVECLHGVPVPDIVEKMTVCDSDCQIGEKNSLMGLYRQTNGRNWRRQKDWGSIFVPYCKWDGILCDNRTNHVIAISLPGNGVKGIVGANLGNLRYLLGACLGHNQLKDEFEELLATFRKYLLVFDFAYNILWGSFPQAIATNKSFLVKLQLYRNTGITGGLPNNIGDLKNLQVLSLGETGISGTIPDSIGGLTNLTYLDLGFLNLKGSLSLLTGLTRLQFMYLTSNQISGDVPSEFGTWFPQLVDLVLQDNVLSGIIPSSLGRLTQLEILNLANNGKLIGKLPTSLRFLTALKIVDISGTNFTGFVQGFYFNSRNLASFIAVKTPNFACTIESLTYALNVKASRNSLIELNVQESGIHGEFDREADMISNILSFPRMTFFNLGGNRKLTGALPEPTVSLTYLVNLNVSYCNLTGSFPVSYFSKLEMLREVDIRGNPLLRGHIDWQYFKADPSNLVKEEQSDIFSCPAIRFIQNKALARINPSYYDRRFCRCDVGYYGLGGHCKICLNPGGKCFNRTFYDIPTSNTSYIPTYLQIDKGYWPFPDPNNVSRLLKCPSSKLGKNICNPKGIGQCFLDLSNTTSLQTTYCSTTHLCLKGYKGRLCGVCEKGYYKNGVDCRPCATGGLVTKEIIAVAVAAFMLVLLLIFTLRFSRNKPALVVSLVIVEVVTVLFLASFKIAPGWLAEANSILLLLGHLWFAKTIRGFVKIGIIYVQVTDVLISTSNIWPETVYKAQIFLTSAFNFRFSFLACSFTLIFKPLGKLIQLSVMPIIIVAITCCIYGIWYIVMGRKDRELAKKLRYQCQKFCISCLDLLYFPLVFMAFSVFPQCQQIDHVSFMKNYVWIDCGSKDHTILVIVASIVTVLYIFPGIPVLFCFLLYKNSDKIKKEDAGSKKWLGSLYTAYKNEYYFYIELLSITKRFCIAAVLSLIPNDLDDQSFLITTILVLFIAFEAHTKPFKTPGDDHRHQSDTGCRRAWNKINQTGLENIVNILSLAVLLISFVGVRFMTVNYGTAWNTPMFWTIAALNVLIVLFVIIGIVIRAVTREEDSGCENDSGEIETLHGVDTTDHRGSYSSLFADDLESL